MKKETEKVTIRIPKRFIEVLEFLVEMDDFPTKSEAIRVAIRDLVYERAELVSQKLKRIQEAERAVSEIKELRKEYLRR